MSVIAVCVVVALIIVGLAGYTLYRDNQKKDELAQQSLEEIGATATSAGCTDIVEDNASGAGDHVNEPVDYETNPPAYGPHYDIAADQGIHFYTVEDRPEVEQFVHNLEHGWSIVWYDETVADDEDQMKVLEATADKFDLEGTDPRYNMVIAPWTSNDGEPIADGKHIALTHWSVHQPTYDPKFFAPGEKPDSFGQSQYCDSFSGDVLDEFMKKYPYDDAPEGFLWHQ